MKEGRDGRREGGEERRERRREDRGRESKVLNYQMQRLLSLESKCGGRVSLIFNRIANRRKCNTPLEYNDDTRAARIIGCKSMTASDTAVI